jgi:NAD(P)-dependent dehydrogenase (short-subunit alcohol dehydrogenase family)
VTRVDTAEPAARGMKAKPRAQMQFEPKPPLPEQPMGRPAQPEEVAPALASDADSSFTTGIVLQVPGRRDHPWIAAR